MRKLFLMLMFASLLIACRSLLAEEQPAERLGYAIAIHGGAGGDFQRWTVEQREAREQSLREALRQGTEILKNGGSSLDAVERVILHLEDDPLFNAGRGAVFNAEGGHQLDASIMDGRTKACGAVAAVAVVKNPIALARKVMTETRHVLLVGEGAERFARQMGLEIVEPSYFSTEAMRREWEQVRQPSRGKEGGGTVGCVALDQHGNLAAGTSTGGLTNKLYGRVGDSPIIAAGTYAENATCAVSCTGVGEQYIRHAIAYDVAARMKYLNEPLAQAVRHQLTEVLQPNQGGIIAIDRQGQIVMDFNTASMPRAAADSRGRFEVKLGKD